MSCYQISPHKIYYFLTLLLFLLFNPVYSQVNSFVDVGTGISQSDISKQRLTDGILASEPLDTKGLIATVRLGHYVTDRIAFSIQYSYFDETLDFGNGGTEQQSSVYGLGISYDLYKHDRLAIGVGFGYEKWFSKIKLPQARLDFSTTPVLLIFEDTTYTANGNNPYIFLNLTYQINPRLFLGFKYEYHEKMGYKETLFDREKLMIGDIPGAMKIDSPINFSVDVYSIFIRWAF